MRLFWLDVSLAMTAICVISEHGKIVNEAQIASEPEALVRWAREQEGTVRAAVIEGRLGRNSNQNRKQAARRAYQKAPD